MILFFLIIFYHYRFFRSLNGQARCENFSAARRGKCNVIFSLIEVFADSVYFFRAILFSYRLKVKWSV